MAYQCWKCKAQLKSKRESFCPACGIVSPVDGKQRVEGLRRKSLRSDRWESVIRILAWLISLVAFLSMLYGIKLMRSPYVSSEDLIRGRYVSSKEDRDLATWSGGVTIILSVGAFYGASAILGFAVRRTMRMKEVYRKAEANLETIHPDFLPENVLLRPAEQSTQYTLLHPMEGNAAADQQLLLRPADADEQD